MDELTDVERQLKIVRINDFKKSQDIPIDVLHPESIHFQEEEEVTIKRPKYVIIYQDRPKKMLAIVERQVKEVKEKSQRIKYYLNELKY